MRTNLKHRPCHGAAALDGRGRAGGLPVRKTLRMQGIPEFGNDPQQPPASRPAGYMLLRLPGIWALPPCSVYRAMARPGQDWHRRPPGTHHRTGDGMDTSHPLNRRPGGAEAEDKYR
jgi:hypothetical protein